jgi:hypothetical protein
MIEALNLSQESPFVVDIKLQIAALTSGYLTWQGRSSKNIQIFNFEQTFHSNRVTR